MVKYKVSVSFDEKNFFWIVVDNGVLIKNPTKEDLKDAKNYLKGKTISYNKTNICDKCREECKIGKISELTEMSILYPGNSRRETRKDGYLTNTWFCKRHGLRSYDKNDHNSTWNLQKSIGDRRTGNLNNVKHIFGDNCQELTERWTGAEDLNKKNDNYTTGTPIDHGRITKHISIMIEDKLIDLYGKVPQTKGNSLLVYRQGLLEYENWSQTFTSELDKEFDILIFYCVSKDRNTIDRIYIFPKSDVQNHKSVRIYKDTYGWYGPFRVEDEKILEYVNGIWKYIRNR